MRKHVGAVAWLIGLLATMNLVALGCGGGASWPRVHAVHNQQFVAQPSGILTVDVMPVDVQLWTYRGSKVAPQTIAHEFADAGTLAINTMMANRGYIVASNIDWDGNYRHNGRLTTAMPQSYLEHTAELLSSYGTAVRRSRGRLLQPHLPYLLGAATGSDATLYVGGWAYVGKAKKKNSNANKVVKGVLIALLIVVVVAILIAAIAGGGKGGGRGLGRVATGAGKVAKGVGQVAVRTTRAVGRAGIQATKTMTRGVIRGVEALGRSNIQIDIYRRPRTHVDYYHRRPNYFARQETPRRGDSSMMVEMVLIENRTGYPLWHASQRFPANGGDRKQVQAVFRDMLSTLPSRYRPRK